MLILGACIALGLAAYAADDVSLIQSKVAVPKQDQDDLDLEAAEADIEQQQRQAALRPAKVVQEAAPAMKEPILTEEETQGAADAELEAMQAEESEEDKDDAELAEQEDGSDEGEGEEQEEVDEEFDAEKAKEALKQRIAERSKLAQANNYSFTVGATVFVAGKKGKVTWDGRPDHEFLKVQWLEGPQTGKTSGVIAVEDCSTTAQKTVEIGTGRHLKKRVTSAAQLQQKKKRAPKVRDTSRRRRSVLRRIVYGIKKMPMVMSIPFKGLKTGVETIQSEMTAHTGLAFNGSLIDLLNVGSGTVSAFRDAPEAAGGSMPTQEVRPRKPRKNLTEIVRNKTFAAVMKMHTQQLAPLMTAFTNEIRIPELGSNVTLR